MFLFVMLYAIWYHLYNLKNVKKHPWRNAFISPVDEALDASIMTIQSTCENVRYYGGIRRSFTILH